MTYTKNTNCLSQENKCKKSRSLVNQVGLLYSILIPVTNASLGDT